MLAFAATRNAPGYSITIFLAQITLLLLVGRLFGELAQRIGQPAVMGQLAAGIVLGPSVFGALLPHWQQVVFPSGPAQKAMLDAVAQLGVLMLLLLTGMETNLAVVSKVKRAALSVSFTGIAIPFACGFLLGEWLPAAFIPDPNLRLVTSLFLGTALSISSVKIVAMVIREVGFTHRRVGQVLIASAILDDTIGWVIIALIFGIAERGSIDAMGLLKSLLGTFAFLALSFTVGRRLVAFLIRWANDHLLSEMAVITLILALMCGLALTTDAIGVHTVLGAFVAGMLIGQSPILTRHIDEQLRGLIVALFMPVFFGLAGLSADLSILKNPALLSWAIGLILVASVGKFAGAFLGGAIGGLQLRESIALACGMNARGSTEVIVASIGLSMGALNSTLFTLIVTMAIITTLAMPPMLRWALSKIPVSKEETQRLQQEEFEKRGFVPGLERILAVTDASASGRLALRLVGLLAGPRGMPVSIIKAQDAVPELEKTPQKKAAAEVKAAIEEAHATKDAATAKRPGDVNVVRSQAHELTEDIVAKEASKGFDLLWLGLEPTTTAAGEIVAGITRTVTQFKGVFAISLARGSHVETEPRGPLRILVPITGTAYSRNATEVALSLAHATRGSLTAMYVSQTRTSPGWTGRLRRTLSLDLESEGILKDVADLAQHFEARMRPLIQRSRTPETSILEEFNRGHYDLMVVGVTARPGDRLYFGNTAQTLLAKAERSLLLVSS